MVEPVVLFKILEFFRAAEVSLHNTIKRKKPYDPFYKEVVYLEPVSSQIFQALV